DADDEDFESFETIPEVPYDPFADEEDASDFTPAGAQPQGTEGVETSPALQYIARFEDDSMPVYDEDALVPPKDQEEIDRYVISVKDAISEQYPEEQPEAPRGDAPVRIVDEEAEETAGTGAALSMADLAAMMDDDDFDDLSDDGDVGAPAAQEAVPEEATAAGASFTADEPFAPEAAADQAEPLAAEEPFYAEAPFGEEEKAPAVDTEAAARDVDAALAEAAAEEKEEVESVAIDTLAGEEETPSDQPAAFAYEPLGDDDLTEIDAEFFFNMEEEPERDHGRTEEPHEGDVSPFAEDADLNDISQSIAQRLGELEAAAEDADRDSDRIVISDLPDDAVRTGPETDAGDKKESHGDGSRKKKKKKKK
ncbi:MAG: hypothetical protein IJK98_11540, partial [Clostridia bacterium]|nr:hypothetical protein [Clostridia bacterium]